MEKRYKLDKLEELSGGDQAFMKQMIGMYLEEEQANRKVFAESLESGDYDAIRALAHKIKPTLDLLGLPCYDANLRLKESIEKGEQEATIKELCQEVIHGIEASSSDLRRDF